jgi:hypothetical protein
MSKFRNENLEKLFSEEMNGVEFIFLKTAEGKHCVEAVNSFYAKDFLKLLGFEYYPPRKAWRYIFQSQFDIVNEIAEKSLFDGCEKW